MSFPLPLSSSWSQVILIMHVGQESAVPPLQRPLQVPKGSLSFMINILDLLALGLAFLVHTALLLSVCLRLHLQSFTVRRMYCIP